MKLKGLYIIITALLVLSSTNQAVVATNFGGNSVNNGFVLAGFDDSTDDFDVEVWFVGTSAVSSGELTETDAGTYDVVSDASFTTITVKVNISGYTDWGVSYWEDGNETNGVDEEDFTLGQLILVIDGQASVVGNGYLNNAGSAFGLTQGDHTVTFLYAGKGPDGFEWASDTIIVRVREAAADFGAYTTAEVDLTVDVTDEAEAGTDFYVNATYLDPIWYSFYKNGDALNPTADIDVSYTAADAEGTLEGVTISGTVNSTGFDGLQVLGDEFVLGEDIDTVTSTVGHHFVLDAAGVAYLGDATPAKATIRTYDNQATYVGLLVLAEFGRTSIYFEGIRDHEGMNYGATGSFDFKIVTDGSQEISFETFTEEAPGFGAIEAAVGLFSLGVIAFVVPRLRKEN